MEIHPLPSFSREVLKKDKNGGEVSKMYVERFMTRVIDSLARREGREK
jgi:hypothetical protein